MDSNFRLVCGRHAVKSALGSGRVKSVKVVAGTNQNLAIKAKERGILVEEVSARILSQMVGTEKHQNILAICQPIKRSGWMEMIEKVANPLAVVLDQVQDPRNLGSCLRTAGAMGAHVLIHPQRRSANMTSVARKVASGAEEYVGVDAVTNIARELQLMRDKGLLVIGADTEGGVDVNQLDEKGPIALVLGGESKGIRPLTQKL